MQTATFPTTIPSAFAGGSLMKKGLLSMVFMVCALTATSKSHADTSIYEPYCFDSLAGAAGTPGSLNGTGGAAQFNQPWGLAVAGDGTIYVADTLNHAIRKITPAGVVTLLAGTPGTNGFADSPSAPLFDRPTGVAVDAAGNVYVADYNNQRIRVITPGGVVSTLAGSATIGVNDGTGAAAEFHNPFGVALNSTGSLLYVSDQNNQSIRVITLPGGVVTTFAGQTGAGGYTNGTNAAARFNTPKGIAVDSAGNVYVADSGNMVVRKILAGGGVGTLAGDPVTPFLSGFNDGAGAGARFSDLFAMSPFGGPCGVAVDSSGNVYVTDQGNPATFRGHTIRKITPAGNVTTLAGTVGTPGSADGTGAGAGFHFPAGVAVDSSGRLYVADTVNHLIRAQCCACVEKIFVSYNNGTIRQFDTAGTPTTFATGLSTPKGLAINAGFLYVANTGANAVLKFPASGGSPAIFSSAGLNGPYGLAFDSAGDLYAANYTGSTIQRLNGSNGATVPPFPVTSANMNGPVGLAFDAVGNIYAASLVNNTIQKFTASGTFISDFVPNTGGLSAPEGLAIRAGVLYVANYITSVITMFDVSNGSNLGNYATAADGLLNPVGIAFNDAGHLYVANAGSQSILKFTAAHVGMLFSNIANESPDFIAIHCEPAAPAVTINLYPGLTIHGSVGCQYRIETSTDLINWTPLTTFILPTSPYLYLDSTPATGGRFYRVVMVP